MTSLTFTRRTSVIEKGNVADKVRAFIAEHVGFDVDCVTVDSHFRDDLGMDLLDVVTAP
jgi:acyl carrier protein